MQRDLDEWLTVFVWFATSVLALGASMAILMRAGGDQLGLARPRDAIVPLGGLAALLLEPVQNNLLNGQVNLHVLFFCVVFIAFMGNRPVLAATALAAAVSMKVVPGILFGLLFLERRMVASARDDGRRAVCGDADAAPAGAVDG